MAKGRGGGKENVAGRNQWPQWFVGESTGTTRGTWRMHLVERLAREYNSYGRIGDLLLTSGFPAEALGMSDSHPASHFLSREFAPTGHDRWRWWHTMQWTQHGKRAFMLLKQIESDAATAGTANPMWLLKYRPELRWAAE